MVGEFLGGRVKAGAWEVTESPPHPEPRQWPAEGVKRFLAPDPDVDLRRQSWPGSILRPVQEDPLQVELGLCCEHLCGGKCWEIRAERRVAGQRKVAPKDPDPNKSESSASSESMRLSCDNSSSVEKGCL